MVAQIDIEMNDILFLSLMTFLIFYGAQYKMWHE